MLTEFVYLVSTELKCGYWTVSKTIHKRIGEIVTKIK